MGVITVFIQANRFLVVARHINRIVIYVHGIGIGRYTLISLSSMNADKIVGDIRHTGSLSTLAVVEVYSGSPCRQVHPVVVRFKNAYALSVYSINGSVRIKSIVFNYDVLGMGIVSKIHAMGGLSFEVVVKHLHGIQIHPCSQNNALISAADQVVLDAAAVCCIVVSELDNVLIGLGR